jgi:hypothetical protein
VTAANEAMHAPSGTEEHRFRIAAAGAETVGAPSASSVHCAGRKTTPSGTTPCRTSRHRAIRSLRAKATIMGSRAGLQAGVKELRHSNAFR